MSLRYWWHLGGLNAINESSMHVAMCAQWSSQLHSQIPRRQSDNVSYHRRHNSRTRHKGLRIMRVCPYDFPNSGNAMTSAFSLLSASRRALQISAPQESKSFSLARKIINHAVPKRALNKGVTSRFPLAARIVSCLPSYVASKTKWHLTFLWARGSWPFKPESWCVSYSCCCDVSNSITSSHLVLLLFLSISMGWLSSLLRGTSWPNLFLVVVRRERSFVWLFKRRSLFSLFASDLKQFYPGNLLENTRVSS